MADAADMAYEHGPEFYERMTAVRQGLLNLATAGLYHLYEHQVSLFVRGELLTIQEEHNPAVLRKVLRPTALVHEFETRLATGGIALRGLSAYRRLDELRLVANVVKHGMGKSANELHAKRPLLFIAPPLRAVYVLGELSPLRVPHSRGGAPVLVRVDRPAMGDGLYVTPEEYRGYADGVIALWEELAAAFTG